MPVHILGKIIPNNICQAYEGDERAFYDALGREEKAAILCLIQRIKPAVALEGRQKGLTEKQIGDIIDDIVYDAVLETILNIQRGI